MSISHLDRYSGMLVGQSTLIDIIRYVERSVTCRDRLVCWLVSQPRLTDRCVGWSVSRDRLSGMLVSHSAGIDSQVCWSVSQPR